MDGIAVRIPASRSDFTRDGCRLAVWRWGSPQAPPLLLVHGWGDTGATFQFIADELSRRYHVIAPDLRGFGDSDWNAGGYWFPDYLADLDALIAAFGAGRAIALVGHSMGGNIAGLLAGVRPERFSHVVLLEGFGLPPTRPEQAPGRYRRWLDGLQSPPLLRDFESAAALRAHLAKLAPRAPESTLDYVATCWARALPGDGWRLKMDPAHKRVNPVLYRREEAAACWSATTAPVLLVGARESTILERYPRLDAMNELSTRYRDSRQCWIDEAGHMLHWEQPAAVAALIGEFLAEGAGG